VDIPPTVNLLVSECYDRLRILGLETSRRRNTVTRLLTISLLALLFALIPALAAPIPKHLMKPDDPICYSTSVGHRMVHELGTREVVEVVTKVEKTDAGTRVTSEWVQPDGKRSLGDTVLATARGLQLVEYAGQKMDPPVWYLKLPHCRDNRWVDTWKLGNQIWELETAGWENVTVPAGTFRAIRVERTELSDTSGEVTGQTTYWYAPDHGCIKWSSKTSSRVLKSIIQDK
jgi:hypothetical protein